MSVLSTADFIAECRSLVGDTGTSRTCTSRLERPQGEINGTNTLFSLVYYPIVTAGSPSIPAMSVWVNKTLLTYGTGAGKYTASAATGQITFGTAPAAGALIEATYNFNWYADSEYYEFIVNAFQVCTGSPATGSTIADRANAAMLAMSDSLMDALKQFVGWAFNERRADEYAHRFASSAAGQSTNIDVVTTNFGKLAERFYKRGIELRDGVYTRRGQQKEPGAAVGSFSGVQRYQTRR